MDVCLSITHLHRAYTFTNFDLRPRNETISSNRNITYQISNDK